jgi:hypothetical protein
VNRSDLEILRAIDRGERVFDWDAWFGSLADARYLTAHGRDVARRAAADLERLLGLKWLPEATDPASRHRIAELGARSPLLATNEVRAVVAYVETVRWWVSLALLDGGSIAGLRLVLKQLQSDITAHRFRHSLAQARIAAQGLARGADVVLEPSKASGGPGDVMVRNGRCEVFIEVVSSLPVPDPNEAAYDDHVMRLWMHGADLSWEGEVPGLLDRAQEERWRTAVEAAAAECLATGSPTEVDGNWGRLTARHRSTATDGTLTGPNVGIDHSGRLARVIDRKAAQTRGAGLAWIWIEDHGGLHQLTPFSAMPIADKLEAFAGLCAPLIADRSHIAGVVWSRSTMSDAALRDELRTSLGLAIQRPLPGRQVRQSIIVHRKLILPDQLNLVTRLLDHEPDWLDWALKQLHVGPLAQCLATQRT